jgi:PKD repeat protein
VYDFKIGTSTITWTAANISGSDACTQTVTITDTEKPTLVLPTPFSECVLSIITATYDAATMDITPARPDYYSFITGDTHLDLDPSKFADNCALNCPPIGIRWQIDFFGGTPASISGTGQPSTHASFQIPGDGVTFNDMIHTITYWITDCNGNESLPVTQNITIKPRPNVIKMP